MHKIQTLRENPALGLLAGRDYIMTDVNAAVALGHESGTVEPVDMPRQVTGKPDSLLIVRPGGFGDLLLMRPALQALIEQGTEVGVSCFRHYHAALAGLPVDLVPYPLPEFEVNFYDQVVTLENVVEREPEAQQVDMPALWASRLNVRPASLAVTYQVPLDRQQWAAMLWPRVLGAPRLAVQLRASAKARTWPIETHLAPALRDLLTLGWQVLVLDEPGRCALAWDHPNLIPVMQDRRVRTFADTAAVLSTCDVFLGPDSALTHLAGALGIPGVALFGPFPSKLRTRHAVSLRAMDGVAPCAPCFHHQGGGAGAFPLGMPCAKSGVCAAMASLNPVRVVHQLVSVAGKTKRN